MQYFLAGIIPAFVLLITYFAFQFVKYYRHQVQNLLCKEIIIFWKIRAKHIYRLIGLIVLFLFFGFAIFQITYVSKPTNIIVAFIGIGEFFIFSIVDIILFEGIFYPTLTGLETLLKAISLPSKLFPRLIDLIFSPFNLIYRFMSAFFIPVVLVGGVSFSIFFGALYPNIPQEFGGVKPRCAFIDIEKDKLSLETLENISPALLSGASGQVSRSVKLDIYYSNNSVLLVKPHNDKERFSYNTATYEIDKDVVHGIYWCER